MRRRDAPRPGGRNAAGKPKARAADQAPAVWQSLINAFTAYFQLAIDELDAAEESPEDEMEELSMMLNEQMTMLESVKKRKLPYDDRMGVLGMVGHVMEQGYPVEDMSVEQAEELQLSTTLTQLSTALFAYLADCITRAGGSPTPNEATVVASNKLQKDSEDEAVIVLKIIDTLVTNAFLASDYCKAALRPHVAQASDLLLHYFMDKNRGYTLREAILAAFAGLIEGVPQTYSTSVSKVEVEQAENDTPLVAPAHEAFQRMLNGCFELASDPNETQFSNGGKNNRSLATQLAFIMASCIPTKVAKDIFERSSTTLADVAANVHAKKAALIMLAVIPETSEEFVTAHLQGIQNLIFANISASSAPEVRCAAFVCASELVEHAEVSQETSEKLLATVWEVLDSHASPFAIQYSAVMLLTTVCENIKAEDITKAEDDDSKNVVKKLLSFTDYMHKHLQAQDTQHNEETGVAQEELIQNLLLALLTLISNAEAAYKPYAPQTFELLISFMESAGEQNLEARARATSCVGELVGVVGREGVEPYTSRLIPLLNSGYEVKSFPLRSATHVVWSHLVRALKEDVTPHLDVLVDSICKTLDETYGAELFAKFMKKMTQQHGGDDDDEDEDDEGDEDDDDAFDEDDLNDEALEEVDEERRFALLLYKALIETLGTNFIAHHNRCFKLLTDNAVDFQDTVRSCVAEVIASFPKLYPGGAWSKGETLALTDDAKKAIHEARVLLMAFIESANEPNAVGQSLESLKTLLETYGQVVFMEDSENHLNEFASLLKQVVEAKTTLHSHRSLEDGDNEDEDVEEEEDEQEKEKHKGHKCDNDDHAPCCNEDEEEDEENAYSQKDIAILVMDVLISLSKSCGSSANAAITPLIASLEKQEAKYPDDSAEIHSKVEELKTVTSS